jgi:hypothetical protein
MNPTRIPPQRARICLVAPEFIGPCPNGGVGTACHWEAGYSSLGATTAHVDHVRSMSKGRPAVEAVEAEPCDIVMIDIDAENSSLDAVRHTFLTSDPTAYAARFLTWDAWRSAPDAARPAIFTVRAVVPIAGMVRRLLNSLIDSRVDAATSYYATLTSAGLIDVAPLGASLECGRAQNVLGGPCLIVRPSAFGTLRRAAPQSFDFRAVNAALAHAGSDIALVPDVLYETDGGEGARRGRGHLEPLVTTRVRE